MFGPPAVGVFWLGYDGGLVAPSGFCRSQATLSLIALCGLAWLQHLRKAFLSSRASASASNQCGFKHSARSRPLDAKGLHAKALVGQLRNFTGVDSAHESPEAANMRIHMQGEAAEASARRILERPRQSGIRP